MPDLQDGETMQMEGSGAKPYELKNVGGVYSCSCPAWRNQSKPHFARTCKHLKRLRGEQVELERIAAALALPVDALPAVTRASRSTEASASPVLLAERWSQDVDPRGWWMSEKLDGVRALWDGRRFTSRLGNAFVAPDWFTQALPDEPLDGELWGGRRRFQRTVSIVRRQDGGEQWREIQFVVFDAPRVKGPFEERLARCEELLGREEARHVIVHPHVECRGFEHLQEELSRVEALGGEGLMLRRPGSAYVSGRSSTLLKVKSFRDLEAKILAHLAGAGKHEGRLGALLVALEDGTRFSVGTGFSDAERESPPPVGAVVRVRYQEMSDGGVPRFPSYAGLREDVEWPVPAGPTTI